jgi:hypothetical protein
MKKTTAEEALSLHAELNDKIEAITSALRARAIAQLSYDVSTNLPKGILNRDELIENALNQGFTSGAAAYHQYGCEPAVNLAYSILEDCNCHREAKALVDEARKGGLAV